MAFTFAAHFCRIDASVVAHFGDILRSNHQWRKVADLKFEQWIDARMAPDCLG